MHILISALSRFSKPSGLCRHAANLAQCLASTDKVSKITLVLGAWQKHYFETSFNLNSKNLEVITVKIKNTSLSRNIWFAYGLPKIAKAYNPDIIHLSFPIPFFRSLFSSPVVSTIHDLYPFDFPENFGFFNAIFNRLFLKQCVNNSDGIVCVSCCTLERFKFYFSPNYFHKHPKQVDVIYNYVDFHITTGETPKNFTSLAGSPFLLCVAQHRKNKNLDLSIKSFSSLFKQRKIKDSSKLIIVGSSGPETENIHSLIHALSLQEHVLLFSAIDDCELSWLYQNCALFLSSSSTEGFCLPLVEALYFSCRVVCSDIPIFREVCSSDCTYFDLQGDSIKNLSNAIVQALEKPRPDNTFNLARFSKSSAASQYLTFYSTLI